MASEITIQKRREYARTYYVKHKERISEQRRKYYRDNIEKVKEYNLKRAVLRRKKKPKVLKPTEQIARIFKNPATAEHFKWIMRNRGLDNSNNNNEQLKESEVEHEKVE